MDEYESLSHSKWECKYHVVFIPKCRRKTLYGELRRHLGEVGESRPGFPDDPAPEDTRRAAADAVLPVLSKKSLSASKHTNSPSLAGAGRACFRFISRN
jgi:hypothetical protein